MSVPTYLADTATGLPIPPSPRFDSPDEERRDRRNRLAATLRLFGLLGFGEGISGHVSIRDPEDPERFWVNPFGVSFRHVTVGDLICVDARGAVVAGRHRINPSAFVIHSAIHRMCPGADAAAHAHSTHARALGALRRTLEPLDQESASFYGDQALYTDYDGPSVSPAQGEAIASTLGDRRAVLLAHHGLITVGRSIDEAAHRFVTYEGCAEVQLRAAAAGALHPMSRDQALSAKQGFGDPDLARASFQLLYDEIVREQPDTFDE